MSRKRGAGIVYIAERKLMGHGKRNPFYSVWRWLSVVAGALALSNMTKDLVQWIDQLADLLATYRAITDPIFRIIQFPFPFEFPWLLRDYIVVGFMMEISVLRAALDASVRPFFFMVHKRILPGGVIKFFAERLIGILFWPIIIMEMLIRLRRRSVDGRVKNEHFKEVLVQINEQARYISKLTLYTFASSFLLVFLAIVINYSILQAFPESETPSRNPRPIWDRGELIDI